MAKKRKVRKIVLNRTSSSRILRVVRHDEGFLFFRGLGDFTGEIAISLADFAEKMRKVDVRSVDFHFKRQDFEKWLRDVIGDSDLSRRVGRITKESHGEKLRNKIIQIVKGRLEELKGTQTKA
jgi:hypothetical protein